MPANNEDFDPFRSGEIARTVPSTEPQREVISSALLSDTANIAFNEAVSVSIPFAIEADAVSRAIHSIVERHESLRASFTRTGDQLLISSESCFKLEIDDQSALNPDEIDACIRLAWHEMVSTPMNLFDGPLLRARLIKLPQERSELVIMAHHIICDGWSFYIILEELVAYLSGAAGLEAPQSFGDFAERQSAEQSSNADIDFWLQEYAQSVPELDLPTDRPRPAERSFAAARADFEFDEATTEAIKDLARSCRASLVQVTFAAVVALLKSLCASEDIAIGLPVARQGTDGLSNMLGHAVQLLPIRVGAPDNSSFSDLVAAVKSKILDAQEHPNFTFGSLVRELGCSGDPSRVPIIPVIFNIDQPFGELSVNGVSMTVRSVPRVAENFELFLNVMPIGDRLIVEATYNTELFDSQTVSDWLSATKMLLIGAAANPNVRLDAIWQSLDSNDVAAKLTGFEIPINYNSWLEQFQEQVFMAGDKIAVKDAQGALTYRELDSRSDGLARYLIGAGISPGDVVAYCLPRSTNVHIVVLGIHKAGATMLPLDPGFPVERLNFMLQDSAARLIITDGTQPDGISLSGIESISVQAGQDDDLSVELPAINGQTNAYLIYTSGSTGQPKGVLVCHKPLLNFLTSMSCEPGLCSDDILLAVTTTSFDISILELLLPIYCGASVYIATKEQATTPAVLKDLLLAESISMLQATPATWRLLLTGGWDGALELKALCGGEALTPELASRLLPLVGELWNMYGPTETTIWSSCKKILPGFDSITVGKPIANTRFVILDNDKNTVPSSVPGELCIGGEGLSSGYLNRPTLTADRFIDSPRSGSLYRTGDKARILRNGEVQFLGRFDDQVKIRGFRIELGEIESALQKSPNIEAAATHIWRVSDVDQRIVACCVPAPGTKLATHKLRKFLRGILPDYMVPQHFIEVNEIPLNLSGKVNRKALPSPVAIESKIGAHSPPVNVAEKVIAGIWQTLVKPDQPIGREAKFFEIGGYSLLGLEAIHEIEKKLNVRLHPRILYTETLAGVAAECVGDDESSSKSTLSRPERLEDSAPQALSFAQLDVARAWITDVTDTSYNLPSCFKLSGRLDVQLFRNSVAAVIQHNAALTTVLVQSGSELSPSFIDSAGVPDLVVLDNIDCSHDALLAYVADLTRTPTDLFNGPLVKASLIRVNAGEHYFVFIPHQFAYDGWSFDIFLRQLSEAYASNGKLVKPDAQSIRYRDFAAWQREQVIDSESQAFWQLQSKRLSDLPDWQFRTANVESGIGIESFELSLGAVEKLEGVAQTMQSQLADVTLAVFVEILAASAGAERVTLNLATSGRYFPELFSIIGLFYQDLPVAIESGQHLDETIQSVGDTVRSLGQHQNVSRSQIEKAIGGSLLEPKISFSYQQATERPTVFGNLGFSQLDVPRVSIRHDLEFWLRRNANGLVAQLDYRADTVDGQAVKALAENIHFALRKLAADETEFSPELVAGLFRVARDSEKPSRGFLSRLLS